MVVDENMAIKEDGAVFVIVSIICYDVVITNYCCAARNITTLKQASKFGN